MNPRTVVIALLTLAAFTGVRPHGAAQRVRRSPANARIASDPGNEAEARRLVRAGDRDLGRGRIPEAMARYQEALSTGAESPAVAVAAHAGMSRALNKLDELAEAQRYAELALRSSLSAVRQDLEVLARLAAGISFYNQSRYGEALEQLERTIALAERVGDERSRSEALLHVGFASSDMGEEVAAVEAYREALASSEPCSRIQGLSLMGLGHTSSKLGDKQVALDFYVRSRPLLEQSGDPAAMASLASGMGYVYFELGDFEAAESYFSQAISLNDVVGSRLGRAGNLVHLARVHAAMERHEQAVTAYGAALDQLVALPDRGMEPAILAELAGVLGRLGRTEASAEAYGRALAHVQALANARSSAEVLNELGRVDLGRGELARARIRFSSALELSRRAQAPFAETQALFHLARVDHAAGNLQAALALVEEALERAEELRSRIASPRLRSAHLALARELHALEVDLLMALHARDPRAGFDRRAFDAAEEGKARAFLDRLGRGPGPSPAGEPELVALVRQLEGEIARRAAAWEDSRRSTGSHEVPGDLDRLLLELDEVQAVLRSRQRAGSASPLVNVGELQSELLDESTALISYFVASEASYAWVATRSTLHTYRIPPERELVRSVAVIRSLLSRTSGGTAKERHRARVAKSREYRRAASELSASVLGPALRELRAERLLIAADGALHKLPFSALPLPDGPSEAYLMDRYEVVRVPSASAFRAIARRSASRASSGKGLAVLADPVFDLDDPRARLALETGTPEHRASLKEAALRGASSEGAVQVLTMPRLLSSREEARAILDLVAPEERLQALGFSANRELLTSGRLARYDVLHIATHGLLNVDRPELSGVALSLVDARGRHQNGYLRLYDIHELELPVRLLVLSACSTALGKDVRGEGIVGLVGGFLASGASGVVASYWDVEDEATSELMRQFYEGLFTERMTASAALRRAQKNLMEDPRWRFPYYFGSFELHGYWR